MTPTTTSTVPPTTVPPSTVPATVPPVRHATPKGSPASTTHPRPVSPPTTTIKTEQSAAGGWNTAEASWYGPGFYGHGTACGQTYNSSIVGVAHKTYACGTQITFEYQGRVVTAPVIDRGPYVKSRPRRLFDLSHGLCERLGHCFTGDIHWRLGG